jgi:hypothetical protein
LPTGLPAVNRLGPTCHFFHFRLILARIVGQKNGPELYHPFIG